MRNTFVSLRQFKPSLTDLSYLMFVVDEDVDIHLFYSESNELLYVGISTGPIKRLEQHKQEKSWIDEVCRIEVKKFANRSDALLAEADAIENEYPLHNKSSGSRFSKINVPNNFSPCVLNIADDSMYLKFLGEESLTLADKAVFHGFLSFVKNGNLSPVEQQAVAKRLNCSRRLLTMSTKKLVELGFLERSRDTTCEYRIPKSMAYCGSWKLFNIDD